MIENYHLDEHNLVYDIFNVTLVLCRFIDKMEFYIDEIRDELFLF